MYKGWKAGGAAVTLVRQYIGRCPGLYTPPGGNCQTPCEGHFLFSFSFNIVSNSSGTCQCQVSMSFSGVQEI